MLSEHSRAVIDKQAIGRCFISHEHVQMAITVEVSQFDSLGGVIYLWQVLAGTVDKEPGASRVVDPQKVLPFLAGISHYHVRKAVSVYIPDIQSVALAHSQEAIANVAEGAVSIAQVIFVGLVIF